ncbi:MAG: hypothetical protein IJF17_00300 [Thermoguttaceae bacterium]|nr:hypothetical protein [Thermoguttaceae bacterium]
MAEIIKNPADEINAMIRNAELRSELEPYYDESIVSLDERHLPLDVENEYLEMMLAWEMAPVLPISQWFDPPLCPRHPSFMTQEEVRLELRKLAEALYEKQIVLDFTDHLSDRELYLLICQEILPSKEKMLAVRDGYLHWDCASVGENQEIWLTYYASDEEREIWEEMNDRSAPLKLVPPYLRDLPSDPNEEK